MQAAVSKLDSFVSQSESFWKGPGADEFRAEWAQFKPQAQKMIQAVQADAPQAVNTAVNAIQQATGVSRRRAKAPEGTGPEKGPGVFLV